MSGISVGAALGEGFGLIRRRPLAVLAWGAILVALQAATFTLFAPYYMAVYGAIFESLAQGTGPLPVAALTSPEIRRMQSLQQLFNIVQLFVAMIVYCAAFRAVLHPERSAFAYLRVGAPELFLAVLSIAGIVALVIALVIAIIPVSIVLGIVIAASHGAGAMGLTLILIPIVLLAMLLVGLFVGVRFAFVGPMMVEDGKFHLFESWTLTRGRVGSLMLLGLGLFAILLLADIVLLAVLIGGGVAVVQSVGGLGPAAALLHGSPQALLAKLAPVLVIYVIVQAPLAGCLVAIASAPWARAYRDLLPDAASTFA
jgi:hypothetical protein